MTVIRPAPSMELLKRLYRYDGKTGLFYHKRNTGRGRIGAVAGRMRNDGYLSVSINGLSYLGHRLAWYYVHGTWPSEIDHKNRNRSDTRIDNLRIGTRTQNIGNGAGWAAKKKSGLPRGVYFHPADKTRFRAQIFIKYKAVHLGVFETVDEAVTAYKVAAREHFGEFAT